MDAGTTSTNGGPEIARLKYGATGSRGMSDKKRRLLMLSEIISPYRIPVFNALAKNSALDLHVVFLAETDAELRRWPVYKNEIRFSCEVLPSWRLRAGPCRVLLNWGLRSSLRKFGPDTVICGGYNYVASWLALSWARRHHVEFILWSESNEQDARRGWALVESTKSHFLARCDRFVVPGKASFAYLQSLGSAREKITVAPNAVDNRWFAVHSDSIRARPDEFRAEYGLPSRFVIFAGRLVRAKGVFDLLDAYGRLEDDIRSEIGLVFAGDGECRRELERRAERIRPGRVCFPGFVHREELAGLFALAEVLILPTHSDTWGLVVNEAMACSLPIILTSVAGCSTDLVEQGWNGYIVPPRDPERLSLAIRSLIQSSELRRQMSERALERIQDYSPEACAAGLAAAALSAGRQGQ